MRERGVLTQHGLPYGDCVEGAVYILYTTATGETEIDEAARPCRCRARGHQRGRGKGKKFHLSTSILAVVCFAFLKSFNTTTYECIFILLLAVSCRPTSHRRKELEL